MSWAPLRYAVTRPLHGYSNIRRMADDSWELSPTIVERAPAAVFDASELSRVVGVEPRTTMPYELSRVHGGRVTHAATRIYKIANASLAGSHVFVGSTREQVSDPQAIPWLPRGAGPSVEVAMMCGSVVSSVYFGHWVTEQLTAELLAGDLEVPAYRASRQAVYLHEEAFREATGLHVNHAERIRFEQLLLLDDYGQNESKRRRYERLRAALRRGAASRGARGVFVHRGDSGAPRSLVNEPAIVERLSREGFAVVHPEREGAAELRDTLCDAPVVVGVEGSALIHAIMMMPERGRLLVVQPPDRFNNVHKDYADCLGMRYGFTVADLANDGFWLPPDRLLRAIERLVRA